MGGYGVGRFAVIGCLEAEESEAVFFTEVVLEMAAAMSGAGRAFSWALILACLDFRYDAGFETPQEV